MAIRVLSPSQCFMRSNPYSPYLNERDIVSFLMNQRPTTYPFSAELFQPSSAVFFKFGAKQPEDERSTSESEAVKPFSYKLWLKGFSPANVQVKVDGQKLVIDATKEDAANDGLQSHTRHQFCRSIVLPDDVDTDQVKSHMNDNGVLEISAPRLANKNAGDTASEKASCSEIAKKDSATEESLGKPATEQPVDKTVDAESQKMEDPTPVSTTLEVEKQFSRKFDIRGFSPDDVQVKVSGRNVTVTAKKEEKKSFGGIDSYAIRELYQSLLLPENVNSEQLASQVNEDGVLEVTAPCLSCGAVDGVSEQQKTANTTKSTNDETTNTAANQPVAIGRCGNT